MCHAAAWDIQQLTLRLADSEGGDMTEAKVVDPRELVRPDLWLPEQRYRRAVLAVNQVLQRIADRVGQVVYQ
ncbi:unnamed protein product, partial [Heterosigma akashiwo]